MAQFENESFFINLNVDISNILVWAQFMYIVH